MAGIIATKVTNVDLGSDRLIENGEPIYIHGMMVTVTASVAVNLKIDLKDVDDNDIGHLSVPTLGIRSIITDFGWYAGNGLKAASVSSDVRLTIFHSQGGA